MIAFGLMEEQPKILLVAGPTASGKSSRAVEEALKRNGEIISVDSRQVYRMLDIGTEKITAEEMCGVPHHLIDIRDPKESYSAGDFVEDATLLIGDITARDKLPILVGGTHFYFDALLHGLPARIAPDPELREKFEKLSTILLFARIRERDPRRAAELDPKNRRRLIRALEIIEVAGFVPKRAFKNSAIAGNLNVEWIVLDPPSEELKKRIETRLRNAFLRGLVDEVRRVRDCVGNTRLNEFGLEYRIIGEYLRLPAGRQAKNPDESLLPALSAKLWQLARHQRAWLRKLGHPMS